MIEDMKSPWYWAFCVLVSCITITVVLMFSGCGSKGDKGLRGDKGDIGAQGPAGPQGPQGPSGRNTGGVGNTVDGLVTGTNVCRGRLNIGDDWFDLRLWAYDLRDGNRFLFGRSDLVGRLGRIPDSGSFFGNQLWTSEFRFWFDDDEWNWELGSGGRTGVFDCEYRD